MAIQIHGWLAVWWTTLALSSAATSGRAIMTSGVQRMGWTCRWSGQGGHPWHQQPQVPLACDTHGATDGTPRDPFHQHALGQPSGVIRDEVWCEAVDTLMTAGMALMGRFAVVEVAIVLVRGRLTPWTPVSDAHRLLLTTAGVGSVVGQQEPGIAWRACHGVHDPHRRVSGREAAGPTTLALQYGPRARGWQGNSITFYTRL
jgi:hypothetical protein